MSSINKRLYISSVPHIVQRDSIEIWRKRFPLLDIVTFDEETPVETFLNDPLAKVVVMYAGDPRFGQIRPRSRKDIFLAGYMGSLKNEGKELYLEALALLKGSSANLMLAFDPYHNGMIVTPEEAAYHEGNYRFDYDGLTAHLADMAFYRSHLTFTQSTVVSGEPVDWNGPLVPHSLRTVVNHCIKANAYKAFKDATVGHFAHKIDDQTFLTSIRKSNFNRLDEIGMVLVRTDGPDTVIAYGAKPSVGGQSQRLVFHDHKGFDSIVHFHSPLKSNPVDAIPVASQREVECGSHQCGRNTSDNLASFENGEIKAVMLDQHGPNIVFNKNIDPQKVIDFIERNFDLSEKTGGYNL